MNVINIAVDGPAGAGKSTVSRAAAKRLGYVYVDTGALYRAVGVNAMNLGAETTDAGAVEATLKNLKIELFFSDGEQRVLLNGKDVSGEIRTPKASMAASNVSAIPKVREYLFDLQKNIAAKTNCLMDGRDIGTVVLPNAKIKIFLTADVEERANRRYKELIEKGNSVKFEDVLADVRQRDYNDSNREIAPLKPAKDSVILDTTGLSLEQSIEKMMSIINDELKK